MKRMKYIYLLNMLLLSSLLSCIDEDFMENTNGDFLRIEVIDENIYGTEDELSRAEYSGLHTEFEEGDAIGVYAVNGTSTVSSNVKFVLTDGVWIPQTKVPYNPDYTYYAYFPYTDSPYSPSFSSSSLDEKFANFISDSSNKFWNADQSTKNNFTAANLMISQGKVGANRTIKFTMKHKRALIILEGELLKWCFDSNPDIEYPVSIEFIDNKPYNYDGNRYFLIKPGTSISFGDYNISGISGKYKLKNSFNISFIERVNNDGSLSYVYSNEIKKEITPDGITKFILNAQLQNSGIIKKEYIECQNTDILRAIPFKNEFTDLSLTNNDGTPRTNGMTTANCYLVHASGNYKLPLVYGNAIKNGMTNTSSYHSDLTGSNILSDFLNHNNFAITNPWLKNNGVTVDGAELVWQDVQGLISSVGIVGDYLTFTVSKDNIAEGNAVIAAKQGDTIVWSWHIWVTPETLNDLVEIDTGVATYKVSPVNVGQINYSLNVKEYEKILRKYQVSPSLDKIKGFIEFETLENIEKKINCSYCVYYQWGRKDPEIPLTGIRNEEIRHLAYDINGNNVTMNSAAKDENSVSFFISNPKTRYLNTNMYYYLCPKENLWNLNNENDLKTTKTIYDPCPPDFCVMPYGLANYLGQNGLLKHEEGQYDTPYFKKITNIEQSFNLVVGYYGYINSIKDDTNIHGVVVDGLGPISYWWTSKSIKKGDLTEQRAYTLYTFSKIENRTTLKSTSLPIRPVAEDD